MTFRVRYANLDDLDQTAGLFDRYRQFYGQPADARLARDFIHERMALRESVILLACDEKRAIGFTQLYPSFSSVGACRILVLNDLFVEHAERGRGAGRALLEAARHHAQATGARRLVLETAQDNPAQTLYESLGYVRESGFLHYSLKLG